MNFNEDISGVRNAVSTLERENSALRREVDSLLRLTDGCLAQILQVPSGEPGMNLSMSVIGSLRGPAEAEVGGGGTFLGSYNSETGVLTIGKGSYQYPLGTNVDVAEKSGTGDFAYAIIKQNAGGGLVEFKIEISSTTKDPTNLDATNGFVEFSNVLLGEVKTIPDPNGGPNSSVFIQRRTGNLSLIYRLINGAFCLWPETTGGSSL